MNIIEIATLLSVEVSKIGLYTKADFAEMESKLELEKQNHPDLTDELIVQFFKALKLKKNVLPFQAVMNNRTLFNFFAKKNYSKKQFPEQVENDDKQPIKDFIQIYLIDSLNPMVYDKIHANDFQEIDLLTEAHQFLPDRVSEKMFFYAAEKLDLANRTLKPPFGDFSKIMYIKDAHFFTFLNGLKNEAIEEKVKTFFTTVMNMYIADKTSELAKRTFAAMKSYEALDAQLSKNIGMLKESAEINYKPFAVNRKKYYWIYAIVAIFVVGRVWMFVNDFSNMNSQYDNYETYDDYETESEPRKLDRYYTDMKFNIDSFRVFLADYKESEIKQMSRNVSLKTGDNPFETFYENPPAGDSNHYLTITNKTPYDMVLLENAVLYDSIKIPRSAHFIRAGENLEINFKSNYNETIFNVYLGKKWATFQTNSKHLFIRNHSIIEYRFSELAPNTKEILNTDYSFLNDAVISYSQGDLEIDSEGAAINPLNKGEE